jgi:hypothetical protein
VEKTPAYRWRQLTECGRRGSHGTGGGGADSAYAKAEFHMNMDVPCGELLRQWFARNRMGGLRVWGVHVWGTFLNPLVYGREHPEYFAEVNGSREESLRNFTGKHGGQLCTTNPEVIDRLVEGIRGFFDENPEYDVVGISPNDGGGFCECDRCIALDVECGNPPPADMRGEGDGVAATFQDDADVTGSESRITGPITDRMFTYANAVAEKIAESHPDKMLMLLVYGRYREPPRKVRLAPNVIAHYCVQCHMHWDESQRREDHEFIRELARHADEIAIYEYYDQGNWPGVVRSFPDLIRESVAGFHELGVRHYQTQGSTGFAVNGFNLWLLARALWNPNIDVDEELDAYCRTGFGPAAKTMREYYNLWRMRWKERKGLSQLGESVPGTPAPAEQVHPFDQIRRLYDEEFLGQCEAAIVRARGQVPGDGADRRRIDFVARGLDATRTAAEAARAFYRLVEEEGWPSTYEEATEDVVRKLGPPADVRAKALVALARFEKWEGLLESLRNEFVLSHRWARYCYDSRKTLHPHYCLRRILSLLEGA